jgi:hypothetical protein
MKRPNKFLSLIAIFSIALAITGCVNPPAQNQPVSNTNNNYQSGVPVDVSDLNSSNASYAEQQLQARGFNQIRSTPMSSAGFSNSWWFNLGSNQCFQLETSNGKVMTLSPRTSQDLPHNVATNYIPQQPLNKEKT